MPLSSTTDHLNSSAKWFVLYTRSRCEKKVADGLKERGIQVFCPMIRTRRRWSDRIKHVEEPLLRSYCFVKLTDAERHKVFEVPHVVRYLFWLGKPAVVRETELEALKELLRTHDHHTLRLRNFEVNDRVRFKGGPMDHLQGEILEMRGNQVQLYIEALQLVVYVDTRTTSLEKSS